MKKQTPSNKWSSLLRPLKQLIVKPVTPTSKQESAQPASSSKFIQNAAAINAKLTRTVESKQVIRVKQRPRAKPVDGYITALSPETSRYVIKLAAGEALPPQVKVGSDLLFDTTIDFKVHQWQSTVLEYQAGQDRKTDASAVTTHRYVMSTPNVMHYFERRSAFRVEAFNRRSLRVTLANENLPGLRQLELFDLSQTGMSLFGPYRVEEYGAAVGDVLKCTISDGGHMTTVQVKVIWVTPTNQGTSMRMGCQILGSEEQTNDVISLVIMRLQQQHINRAKRLQIN